MNVCMIYQGYHVILPDLTPLNTLHSYRDIYKRYREIKRYIERRIDIWDGNIEIHSETNEDLRWKQRDTERFREK